MTLSERKKQILCVVVEQYVQTAEPIGSKTVAAALGSSVSSATVRNEMAELESMGLLEQPHTSAGRIPSPQGYRVYVNEIMRQHRLSADDELEISNVFSNQRVEKSQILDRAGNLASRLTTYPAYATASATGIVNIVRFDFIYVDAFTFIIIALLSNDTVKNKLVHLTAPIEAGLLTKLATVFNASFTGIPEDRITPGLISSTERAVGDLAGIVAVIAGFTIELLCEEKQGQTHVVGAMNLLSHPEYQDIEKAQRIIRYLSDDKELARLPSPETAGDVKITIGPENLANELRDSSVMTVRYDAGDGMQGLIGVIGPTRMDYSRVAARLKYIARGLSLLTSDIEPTKPGVESRASIHSMIGDDDFEQED